jgi:hypothetical protein
LISDIINALLLAAILTIIPSGIFVAAKNLVALRFRIMVGLLIVFSTATVFVFLSSNQEPSSLYNVLPCLLGVAITVVFTYISHALIGIPAKQEKTEEVVEPCLPQQDSSTSKSTLSLSPKTSTLPLSPRYEPDFDDLTSKPKLLEPEIVTAEKTGSSDLVPFMAFGKDHVPVVLYVAKNDWGLVQPPTVEQVAEKPQTQSSTPVKEEKQTSEAAKKEAETGHWSQFM